jgi:MOSC domain-containing protein
VDRLGVCRPARQSSSSGQVARCAITTQNPKTRRPDFDTLRVIKVYRGVRERKLTGFGVYGEVAERGHVRLGDPIDRLN